MDALGRSRSCEALFATCSKRVSDEVKGNHMKRLFAMILAVAMFAGVAFAEQNFAQAVGDVQIRDCRLTPVMKVPEITFGAAAASLQANGGLKTQRGSIYDKLGLNLEFYIQDDPIQQAKDYMEGRTPFFRGTYRMAMIAAELFGSDPRTKPYMIMQLTYSLGDHLVVSEDIKTIDDLKGATIYLQANGPHVGFLYDIRKRGGWNYNDINIVWTKDLSASPDSPAEMFVKNPAKTKKAAFVITPDMIKLTGGLRSVGTGAEGTVKGAHVVVSTAEMNYSIADVFLARKDFADVNPDFVTKFVAGNLKGQEEVVDLKKAYQTSGSKKYLDLCKLGNQVFKLDFPAESEDGFLGMIADVTFVGHPGNVSFFTDRSNQHGFWVFERDSLDMVVSRGYAKSRQSIIPSPIDWSSKHFDILTKKEAVRGQRFKAEATAAEVNALIGGKSEKDIIDPFTIPFDFDSADFNPQPYIAEFDRVLDAISKFGNAIVAIRGHVDPYLTIGHFCAAGFELPLNAPASEKLLKRTGTKGNYSWFLNGKPLSLASTSQIIQLIEGGAFDGHPKYNPREVMTAAKNTSTKRAEAVKNAIVKYAASKGITIDPSQIQIAGVGIREPIVALPVTEADQKQNMRVEFRLIRTSSEAKVGNFDFDF
jgi:outer membrane protein OmpA-like peptidoglycan-associated protein